MGPVRIDEARDVALALVVVAILWLGPSQLPPPPWMEDGAVKSPASDVLVVLEVVPPYEEGWTPLRAAAVAEVFAAMVYRADVSADSQRLPL